MSRWKILAVVAAVAVAGIVGYRLLSPAGSADRRGAGNDANRTIPVTAVPVAVENVDLHLDALGTVQALNTVTVRPQVGGQIDSIRFKEGQEIRKDDVIAVIDPRTYQSQLDQAVAKKKQDEAQLGAARSTLKRYEELIQRNFVAGQDLENQRHTVAQLEATVVADAAAIDNARTQLSYTTIRAPIDGLAGIRQVDVGNLVQGGQTNGIVVLTQVHPINVVFTLPEQNLELVRGVGGEPLEVVALDRTDNHEVARGTLAVIDNQIDATTGTFKLKAEFANEDNALWPGQFVNIRLKVRTIANATTVPAQALQRGPEGSYVYVVKDDSTVAMQPVKTGSDAGAGKLMITEGLTAGQRVVTEGQFSLKPGAKV
ncbi:MAG TPA: efflux RND transporter periplasmic adaptor subunit, partial [Tahibacter sp.]|nr:efflux RND transporter periplasmic adaptor subunit [Tahibacter sp.]